MKVSNTLGKNENVVFVAERSKSEYILSVMLFFIGLFLPPLIIIALVGTVIVWFKRKNTEYVITDRRAIIRTGLLSIKTDEINLNKIESVNLTQNYLGFGEVVATGTGGKKLKFKLVKNPTALKLAIENI